MLDIAIHRQLIALSRNTERQRKTRRQDSQKTKPGKTETKFEFFVLNRNPGTCPDARRYVWSREFANSEFCKHDVLIFEVSDCRPDRKFDFDFLIFELPSGLWADGPAKGHLRKPKSSRSWFLKSYIIEFSNCPQAAGWCQSLASITRGPRSTDKKNRRYPTAGAQGSVEAWKEKTKDWQHPTARGQVKF
jgi:hypothetical protein